MIFETLYKCMAALEQSNNQIIIQNKLYLLFNLILENILSTIIRRKNLLTNLKAISCLR